MTQMHKDNLKEYGTKQSVIDKNITGKLNCCPGHKTYSIYTCWGEAVLCSYCEQVKVEGVADAMAGVHGSAFFTYRNYDDFLSGLVSSEDTSGIHY